MNSKFINSVTVVGYLYDTRFLEQRVSKNGGNHISGKLIVGTDEQCLATTTIGVFASEKTKAGKPNSTYAFLKNILDGNYETVKNVGIERATKLKVNGDFNINDWYDTRTDSMVATREIRGSFIHHLEAGDKIGENKFEAEALVYCVKEDEYEEPSVTLKTYVFRYNNEMIPVDFTCRVPGGVNYFLNPDPDVVISSKSPKLIRLTGKIVTNTIVSENEDNDDDIAFGEPVVSSTTRSFQSWEIVRSNKFMEIGDEDILTINDVKQGLAARQLKLEDIKAQRLARENTAFSASSNIGSDFDDDDDDDLGF